MFMAIKDFRNIHDMMKATVAAHPDKPAYQWFSETGGCLPPVSWSEFYQQARDVAKSLMALGVEKNDKVNILSYTCYRWILSDLGITTCGAATVGIYQSNLPKDCQYIINHSDAVVIFAQNHTQLDKLFSIKKDIPVIRKVILFDGSHEDDWVMGFEEFLELGRSITDEALEERINATTSDDVAGIVYTSGTTGVPKGAVLTHDNLTFTSQSALACLKVQAGDTTFLFLPLAHVFARICVNLALLAGAKTVIARGIDTLVDDLRTAQPEWFASVPRIYEKIYAKVVSGAETKGGLALKIFRWACDVGDEVSDCLLNKRPIPALTKAKYKIATTLVFSKLQAALGGRVSWCVSGAAPLNPTIAKFFHAAGILILEGLGMSENTSFTNVNRFDDYRFGWVGRPGPGIEQKIAEDGEILFRGRNVMKEYYKMPAETAETILQGGWQRTGDLGEIDNDDFLRITGRKKDLIITAGGKNIAPAAIEGVLATSKYIAQVCVIGDQRKYLTALVTLDPETVTEYAEEHDIAYDSFEDLIINEDIIDLIDAEVAEKNKDFASFESIKKVTIVPEFTIENGLITPTFKVKKNVVQARFKDEIDAMYPEE
jgi:long-chain acyl-CoA synthetase